MTEYFDMKSIYDSRQRLKFVFIFTAILIAIASLVVSDMLIKDLAQEERQKMEVWAEATRLTASKNTAVDFVSCFENPGRKYDYPGCTL